MRRPFRHNPGVTCFEQHHLPFQMQLGAATDHKTDGLIIADGRGFRLARLRFLPETHRDMNARSEILLSHLPFWRILRLDLLDACVSHFASSENWGQDGSLANEIASFQGEFCDLVNASSEKPGGARGPRARSYLEAFSSKLRTRAACAPRRFHRFPRVVTPYEGS